MAENANREVTNESWGVNMPYTIDEHKHRFAAWAASRAAMTGYRFRVQQGKAILEAANMHLLLGNPDNLPNPANIDMDHRKWRQDVIRASEIVLPQGRIFSHGVASKLINVYLKAGFVCGGHHDHTHVQALHPPIDSVLIDELYAKNIGGFREAWGEARRIRWSKFNSEQYEKVIQSIRIAMEGAPLWKIERYWQGYQ